MLSRAVASSWTSVTWKHLSRCLLTSVWQGSSAAPGMVEGRHSCGGAQCLPVHEAARHGHLPHKLPSQGTAEDRADTTVEAPPLLLPGSLTYRFLHRVLISQYFWPDCMRMAPLPTSEWAVTLPASSLFGPDRVCIRHYVPGCVAVTNTPARANIDFLLTRVHCEVAGALL